MSIVMSAAQLDLKISGGVRVPGVPGRWSRPWSTHTLMMEMSARVLRSPIALTEVRYRTQEWQTCVYDPPVNSR